MFYPNFLLLTCVIFITFTPGFSDVQPEEFLTETQHSVDTSKISEEHLEYERRQAIAHKYLDTLESFKEEWVDPHKMIDISMKQLKEQLEVKTHVSETTSNPTTNNKPSNHNKQTAGNKDDLVTRTDTSNVKASTATSSEMLNAPKERKVSCVLDSIYVTRWLKKLLYRIEKETDKESSAISFSLDSTILESLKEMSNVKLFEVSTIDDIFGNLLAQAVITQKESFTWSRTYVYYSDTLWLTIYGLSTCVIVYVFHRSYVRRPKFTLLCCGVVISVFWHWMHLYQQKKAHKHAELASMQIPTQCKKHDLGLFEHINEYVKSFFATNDCSKYYEALLIDPFWEVSISVAVSEAFTAFIFQPLFAGSRAINSAIKQLFDGLPILLTLALIFFIFLLAIMKCGYSIIIPWFFRTVPQPAITGSRVEEVQQSNLIEAVCNAASSIQSAAIDSILDEDYTGLSETSKKFPSKSIQYNAAKINDSAKDLQSVASRVNAETILEDELAIQSSYFDAKKYSKSNVKVNLKKRSKEANTSTSSSEASPKRLSTGDNSKVGATYIPDKHANSLDTTRDVSSTNPVQSASNNTGTNVDADGNQEVSNLPESLSDSFEILPLPPDENGDESRLRISYPGPNCDTSMDLLQEMHAGCKFCN